MVLYDFLEQQTPKKQFRFAPPQQRLIASFIDILLFYPLVFLCISPLISLIQQDFFFGSELAFSAGVATAFMLANVFLLSILTFVNLAFGRTPGQRLLHLHVRSFHGGKLTLLQAFQRSLGWMIGIFCFGIPFFEVMTHPFRFTFYDRMSETYVETSESKWIIAAPAEFEVHFGRWVLLSAFVFTCLCVAVSWNAWISQQKREAALIGYDEGKLCDAINPELLDREKRLELSLVLAYVDSQRFDCLDKEIAGFWFKRPPAASTSASTDVIKSPQDQLTLHHFLRFKDMSFADYKDVCKEASQVCLLIKYINDKRSGQKISQEERLDIVEKLRKFPARHLLADWIILDEDLNARHFLAASSRIKALQISVDGEAEELLPVLEDKYVQIAWAARDEVDRKSNVGPEIRSRVPASVKEVKERPAARNDEALKLLEGFKDRYGIE